MTNDPSGNAVIVNHIHSDGTIVRRTPPVISLFPPFAAHLTYLQQSYARTVSTNGTGLHGRDTPPPNGPDALYSAGPVTVAGEYLYVVNVRFSCFSPILIVPHLHPLPLPVTNSHPLHTARLKHPINIPHPPTLPIRHTTHISTYRYRW